MFIRESKINKENHLPQTKIDKKLPPGVRLETSFHEALEDELGEFLNKLEHRAEILVAISQDQCTSGCYELAELYRKQAMNSKANARSIRKLLKDLA